MRSAQSPKCTKHNWTALRFSSQSYSRAAASRVPHHPSVEAHPPATETTTTGPEDRLAVTARPRWEVPPATVRVHPPAATEDVEEEAGVAVAGVTLNTDPAARRPDRDRQGAVARGRGTRARRLGARTGAEEATGGVSLRRPREGVVEDMAEEGEEEEEAADAVGVSIRTATAVVRAAAGVGARAVEVGLPCLSHA